MITRNFKNILATCMARSSGAYGALPIKGTTGNIGYTNPGSNSTPFPYSVGVISLSLSKTSVGICVGSGNTSATENDYELDNQITSGLSGNTNVTKSVENGKLYLVLDVTLTNTSSGDITVKEIGYVQSHQYVTSQGGSSTANNFPFLMERTVLDSPVTIPAGNFATIRYKIGYSVD